MRRKVDILIAHPGKHHALHLVVGCIKSGALVCYFTPFYRCGLGRLVAALPGKIGSKARGYYHPDIPLKSVISPLNWQIKKLVTLFKNNILFYCDFDTFVAQAIATGKYQANVLITLQDYMPETVRAARERGWHIWSDQILNQSEMMASRIARHERSLGLVKTWQHSEKCNDEVIAAASVVTVPSRYTLDGIAERVVKTTSVVTIPYGASAKQFADARLVDQNQIVILARAQSIRKGGHLLLYALQQCSTELLTTCAPKKIKVVILGNLEPELRPILDDLVFPDSLTVEDGNVAHAEVAQLYRQASLFVMPSLSESMSLACIEALHASLPLIITKYCGVDGFVSGEMGYEVDDTVESLATALVSAFNNQHLWRVWGNNSLKLAKQLTWDAYEQSIKKLTSEILS